MDCVSGLYPAQTVVYSKWSRLQDAANVVVLLTGAAYAVYHLYKVSLLTYILTSVDPTIPYGSGVLLPNAE